MRILAFSETMGIGGTEKAACRWAIGLAQRGHVVRVAFFQDGPRVRDLLAAGVTVAHCTQEAKRIASLLSEFRPDVIHAHMPGFPSAMNLLLDAIPLLDPRIPIVQTNVFGRLDNPRENEFVAFRLFVCWSSCVQAAQRAFRRLSADFFRCASVAVNPLDADDGPPENQVHAFRESLGVQPGEVLFGTLCRPDPVRWDDVPVEAFRVAQKVLGNLKLLIREPPSQVAEKLKHALDSGRFIILPTTTCRDELRLTTASMDAVLHYSKIGESFGYGVAEPMNLGRPAIVNYLPWMNLGQVELARHRECGYAVTNTTGLTRAILSLGGDAALRRRFGDNARRHIRQLADPATSLDRLEMAFACAVGGQPNPTANEDAIIARQMAEYLTDLKFGDTWRDRLALMPFYYRVRFHQWRQVMKRRLATRNIQ